METLMDTPTVYVCRCISEVKGLFTSHIANGNTNGNKPLVYSRGEGTVHIPNW